MPASVKHVEMSLEIVGSSPQAVMERIEIAVRGLRGYTLGRPSADVVQIAFVTKKLLATSTHVCTVSVSLGARGMTVAIHGELEQARIDPLRAAILGTSMEELRDRDRRRATPGSAWPATAPAPGPAPVPMSSPFVARQPVSHQPAVPSHLAVPSLPVIPPQPNWSASSSPSTIVPTPQPAWHIGAIQRPPASFEPLESPLENGRTIMRPGMSGPQRSMPVDRRNAARPIVLAIDDGRRFDLTSRILVGRDPTARTDDAGATLVTLRDGEVSKTHVALGRTGEDAWLEDRCSTNGTMILDSVGRQVVVPSAQRTVLSLPATILIGATRLTVMFP